MLANFLWPLAFCITGFVGLWVIFDFGQSGLGLLADEVPFTEILGYYLTLLPAVVVLTMPLSLLLAILYSLTRMSRRNEIISFLTAGVSLPRMAAPIFLVGVILSLVSFGLHYRLAPRAESVAKDGIQEFRASVTQTRRMYAHIFRNNQENRLWFLHRVPLDEGPAPRFRGVQVIQQHPDRGGFTKYYAQFAHYDVSEQMWVFQRAKRIDLDADGGLVREEVVRTIRIGGWSERPFHIMSSQLKASAMGVPELQDYLEQSAVFTPAQLAPFRTHLWFRFANPWTCFAVTLFGVPLAIVFNRRGMLGSVGWAIAMFFLLWVTSQIAVALGEGQRLQPGVAAWFGVSFFSSIGLVLFYFRANNRDFPTLSRILRPLPTPAS